MAATTVIAFTWVCPETDRDFNVLAQIQPGKPADRDQYGRPTECDTEDSAEVIQALSDGICYADSLDIDQLESAAIAAYYETYNEPDHATDYDY